MQITAEAITATASSPAYPAQTIIYTVNPGQNSVTITMGATPKKAGIDWTLIAIIAGLIAAVITAITVIAYALTHAKKKRRR